MSAVDVRGQILAADIAATVRRARFRYSDEEDLQAGIAAALTSVGFDVEREVRLSARDRIDLLVGRVGIEVKIAGDPRAVLRQLRRYAEHRDRLDALVLVTSRVRHRVHAVDGMPVRVVNLAGAGL